jgi:CHAT domain-containing protein
LITRKVDKGKHINYRDLPYLINQHPVIYNYSASLFAQTLQSERKAAHRARLLALAPINAEFTLSNIYNDEANRDSNYVAPIPGTIDEVKNVHKIFGGKLILGKKATEGKLKALSNQFDIIHIASHGFVNNNYPLYSKLVFNPDMDSINDGLLNTYEIYGMQISAPLVVLSACNTGYGKLYKGEGTVSLARGFYVAGAQNILMTLWSITDKTSNKLVQHFYTNLAEGETVPLSLQKAKLNFIQSADKISAHPFFWAGYISVGEPDVKFAKPQKDRLFGIMAFSTFAVVVITCIVYLLKKRRKQKIRPK